MLCILVSKNISTIRNIRKTPAKPLHWFANSGLPQGKCFAYIANHAPDFHSFASTRYPARAGS
ncbi:MAG: hypothetical protein KAY08_04480, partial [Giesbergeria sp.]|nr:hypothetical protein [Giesbergeria sp.]